jgi:hypothetical protein
MTQNNNGFEIKVILSKLFGMTNLEQEMRKAIAKCTVSKIHGQPTNQDINYLDDELTAIVSSFPSKLGGGIHGHAGLVKNVADCKLFAPGTPFHCAGK